METYNKNTQVQDRQAGSPENPRNTGRVWGGLFVVLVGVLLLARQTGVHIPGWVFSFESILIAVGFYIGLRHSFKGFGWIIPIAIGTFLLLDDFYPDFDVHNFTWPLLIIGFGIFLILKGFKKKSEDSRNFAEIESDDVLESVIVFGGTKKNIISKNFRGGEAVTVFGGTELNMMQADLTGPVVLEIVQVFGGTKLIVPSHWKVHSKEMVAILGGIDDKRPMTGNADGTSQQVLILKGTCVLGGIDIRSY